VKYCLASPFRKMIVQSSEASKHERCSSPDYISCPAARAQGTLQTGGQCPFLQASLMQYCSAASMTKYIPYSESILSRCGTENYRYCELYFSLAEPGKAVPPETAGETMEECVVEGVTCSTRVAYSRNHMWLDENEDGSCHIGVDAFFTRVLGDVDNLSFAIPRGPGRVSAVIHTQGIDLSMIFPESVVVTRTNDYLRANPAKLISHPYSLGWLFEGRIKSGLLSVGQNRPVLLRGRAALDWMRAEVERISRFLHDRCAAMNPAAGATMMDGGTVRSGIARHLDREAILVLFNEFFAL
jgi:glycine cleavage system H lipoate-binding protein